MSSETKKESVKSVDRSATGGKVGGGDSPLRKHRASLIRRIFGLGRELHGANVAGNDELKAEIHADILRMKIAKPQTNTDGHRLISIMSLGQLKELIYEYEMMLGRRPYHKKEYRGEGRSKPGDPITARQNSFIVELFDELNYDARGRSHFCEHVIKKFWPQTRGEANKMIEGLKAIKRKRFNHRGTENTEGKR